MTPKATLRSILAEVGGDSPKPQDSPYLRRGMLGFVLIGLVAGFIALAFSLDGDRQSEAYAKARLVSDVVAAELMLDFEALEQLSDQIERPLSAYLYDAAAGPVSRETLLAIEGVVAGSALVDGGAVFDSNGDLVVSFGIDGASAAEAATPTARLQQNGKLDPKRPAALRFVRKSYRGQQSSLIFQKALNGSSGASLLMSVSYTRFTEPLRAQSDWPGGVFLVDPNSVAVSEAGERTESWFQNPTPAFQNRRLAGQGLFHASDGSSRDLIVRQVPIVERDLKVVAALREPGLSGALLKALQYSGIFLIPAMISIFVLAGFVQNEWKLNDDMLETFARYAQSSDTALQLAEAGAVFWRPGRHDIQFNDQWFRQLGDEPVDMKPGLIELTRRLHPEEKEGVVEGYEAVMSGVDSGQRRRIRLRGDDSVYRLVDETVGATELDDEQIIIIVHRLSDTLAG